MCGRNFLPGVRVGGAGSRAGAANPPRPGDGRPARARAGGKLREPPAAVPLMRHLRARGCRFGAVHARRLGGPIGVVAAAARRGARPARHGGRAHPRRRHACPGAGSWHRQNRDGAALGLSARQAAGWRSGPAGGSVLLQPGPEGRSSAPHLPGFTGVLHADGYLGLTGLYQTGRVIEAACWAHVSATSSSCTSRAMRPSRRRPCCGFSGSARLRTMGARPATGPAVPRAPGPRLTVAGRHARVAGGDDGPCLQAR